MTRPKLRYVLVSLAIVAFLVVALVPAVPYRLTIADPIFPYRLQGYTSCENEYAKNNSINDSDPGFQKCIKQYLIPPINVTGYGSLSFRLLGIGTQPFPETMTVGESDFYAFLQTSGGKITLAQLVGQKDVVFNPQGIQVSNSSISWGFLANNNMTVTVTNKSGQTLVNPFVLVSLPGFSGNYTDKYGVTWVSSSFGDFGRVLCESNGRIVNLTSGASCTAVVFYPVNPPFGSSFRYAVEIQGRLGHQYSITRESFTYSLSPQAADRIWVDKFISLVNGARNGTSLVQSSTLDRFASIRFATAVSQPDISDFGLYADESSFFGANATRPVIFEELLFPNMTRENPYTFVNVLQTSAPGHWAGLTDRTFGHFGYYVGTGPYEFVQRGCPVSEIPGAGINITQYLQNAGCKVVVQQSTWLVLILSS
ncbi:MAG TPA: hypothetical protein VIW22_08710 [Nitrososphaerales archaeon]